MHGGKRDGAGRKKGSNAYGESTQPVRVPKSFVEPLKQYLMQFKDKPCQQDLILPYHDLKPMPLPLFSNTVSAGFPSPADDHMENRLDLNTHLIHNQETTFFLRVKGDSMTGAHIMEDDLLIVDRSLTPKHNDVVIAVVHSDITVKRLILGADKSITLKAENPDYDDIVILDPDNLMIWGVVTNVIHKMMTTRYKAQKNDRSY